jgi:hypothetical protein
MSHRDLSPHLDRPHPPGRHMVVGVGLEEDSKEHHPSDSRRMVLESELDMAADCRKQAVVADIAGVDPVEGTCFVVDVVEEGNPDRRMEIGFVVEERHMLAQECRRDSAVAEGHCSSADHRNRRCRNSLDLP